MHGVDTEAVSCFFSPSSDLSKYLMSELVQKFLLGNSHFFHPHTLLSTDETEQISRGGGVNWRPVYKCK